MAKKKSDPPAEVEPAATEAASNDADPEAKEDALHQRFREALERKNARHEHHPGTGPSHLGVGAASNDRQRRQFRRKSG
ncbi:MAG: DUF5302 domain-containing protein [Micromonosporaceae bacterium]